MHCNSLVTGVCYTAKYKARASLVLTTHPAMESTPTIHSFLIRFVQEESADVDAGYRVTIRHVQSGEEQRLQSWGEVERFVGRYINLTPAPPQEQSP